MRTGWLLVLAACGGEKFNGPAGGPSGSSGPYPTELSVENNAATSVTVTLTTGEDSETFEDVAPGTATDSRVIEWEYLDTVEVTIDVGTAQGGTVDLAEERSNVVLVSDAAEPEVVTHTPDPGPGGSPGGGGGGNGW
jgi:hypothetical protein